MHIHDFISLRWHSKHTPVLPPLRSQTLVGKFHHASPSHYFCHWLPHQPSWGDILPPHLYGSMGQWRMSLCYWKTENNSLLGREWWHVSCHLLRLHLENSTISGSTQVPLAPLSQSNPSNWQTDITHWIFNWFSMGCKNMYVCNTYFLITLELFKNLKINKMEKILFWGLHYYFFMRRTIKQQPKYFILK